MKYLIIHKWNLCDMLLRRLLNVSVNKVDPDKAALVRAALPGSTLFAYGDMKYLIIHKWNLCDMLLRRLLNVFVNKVDPDKAALVRSA